MASDFFNGPDTVGSLRYNCEILDRIEDRSEPGTNQGILETAFHIHPSL
jgi:hypothetical protein